MKFNRRHILFFAAPILILGVLAGLILLEPREPRYQGRSLSNWLEDVSSTRARIFKGMVARSMKDAALESNAVHAVRQMGTEAYPFLIEMLRAQDGPVRKTLLQKMGQGRAMKFGLLSADEKRFRAKMTLFRLGTNAAVVWGQILLDRSFPLDLRLASASYCSGSPQEASRTIPTMLQLMSELGNDDQETIRWAIYRFDPAVSLPVLQRYLQESERMLQLAAMRTLKTLGHKARPAIPALEQQLKTLDEQIGLAAADALLSVDVHNVPAIVYRMHHGETGERTGAYWMLPREEPNAQKAMPEIMRGLDDGDPEIRRAAVEGLAKYGAAARSALTALTNLLSDQKRFVRLAASNAVGTIVNSVRPDGMP